MYIERGTIYAICQTSLMLKKIKVGFCSNNCKFAGKSANIYDFTLSQHPLCLNDLSIRGDKSIRKSTRLLAPIQNGGSFLILYRVLRKDS